MTKIKNDDIFKIGELSFNNKEIRVLIKDNYLLGFEYKHYFYLLSWNKNKAGYDLLYTRQ